MNTNTTAANPLRILLVDDNPDDRALVTRELGKEFIGLVARHVIDETTLTEALDTGDFDLVITDYQLHWSDGLQVLHTVKDRLPEMPVIMFTGTGSEEIAVEAMKIGLNDYVLKSQKHLRRLPAAVTLAMDRAEESRRVREAENRYKSLFENNHTSILLLDPQTTEIVDANPAAAAYYGYSRDRLRTMNMSDIRVGEDEQPLWSVQAVGTDEGSAFESRHRLANGDVRDVEVHNGPMSTNGRTLVYSIIHDITERKHAEATIQHMEYHDTLTGLPNRALFTDRAKMAIAHAESHDESLAFLFLDVDDLRMVNHTFGHAVTDQLLREIAIRLTGVFREEDTVARLGGDEIGVLLPDADATMGKTAALKTLEKIERAYLVFGKDINPTMSIGIAVYPNDGKDVDALLRNAETAMTEAQQDGGNSQRLYAPGMSSDVLERRSMRLDLSSAVDHRQFVLHYQPQMHIDTEEIIGAEALIRWDHPEQGLIPPMDFIGQLEEFGLIETVGRWVVEEACRQAVSWVEMGFDDFRMAANVSLRQFRDSGFLYAVCSALDCSGLDSHNLQLEITESMAMEDPDRVIEVLGEMNDLGVTVAIDDFGTGYSSLAYLRRLPVSTIKIDRAFIMGLDSCEEANMLVSAMISLAHNFHLEVIAEGVETREQLAWLKENGCDQAQGFLWDRPLTAEAFTTLLEGSSHTISEDPVHSPGASMPIMSSRLGATSANLPPAKTSRTPGATTTNGTSPVE